MARIGRALSGDGRHPLAKSVDEFLNRGIREIMLPDSYDMPACLGQRLVGYPVPLYRSSELRCPVPLVVLRDAAVIRAPVPEAGVVEDSHFDSGEDDVRAHTMPVRELERHVLTEPEAGSVQAGSKKHLGLGVCPPYSPQVSRSSLRGRPRLGGEHIGVRHAVTVAAGADRA